VIWESCTEPYPIAMFSPQQQTLLKAMQARRFREEINLTIEEAIVVLNAPQLTLLARKPSVVDTVFNRIAEIKQQAWIICGAESVKLLCYGEIVSEFATRDILVGNADVSAARPMTITLEPVVAENNAPAAELSSAKNKLFTLEQIGGFAEQIGYSSEAVQREIQALGIDPFEHEGKDLYQLDAAYRAIDNLSNDAKNRLKLVAAQPVKTQSVAEAKAPAPPRAKKPATASSRTKKKTTPKVTATAE
jgi:hypothetical protein